MTTAAVGNGHCSAPGILRVQLAARGRFLGASLCGAPSFANKQAQTDVGWPKKMAIRNLKVRTWLGRLTYLDPELERSALCFARDVVLIKAKS